MAPIRTQFFRAVILCGAIGAAAYGIDYVNSAPTAPAPSFAERSATNEADRYDIVKRSGSADDLCRQAGIVADAFLMAKDERLYREWKDTARTDCRRAGLAK